MPSFFIAGDVEHLDRDAELLQLAGAAGELLRVEHVGRLVDEIARHARRRSPPPRARRQRLLHRARRRPTAIVTLHLAGALLAFLALGLVAVERIGAQPHAEREVGDLLRLERAAGQVGEDRRLLGPRREPCPWRRRRA